MDITNKYHDHRDHRSTNYALNGKVMLCSVVLLFIVVFVIACFHSYVRCSSHRRRRRHHNRLRISLTTLLETTLSSTSPKALDPSVLKTLPIFTYSATKAAENSPVAPPECAVCLSEFDDGDGCRVLPKCSHPFHIECIDTWFKSQSNCPLCRAPVQPEISVPPPEISITVNEPACSKQQDRGNGEPGSSRCSPSTSFPAEECGRAPMVGVSVEEEVPNCDRYRSSMDMDEKLNKKILKTITAVD